MANIKLIPCPKCGGRGKVQDQIDLGLYFRQKRLQTGESIREVARHMNLSAAYICDLELGRRSWSNDLCNRYLRTIDVLNKKLKGKIMKKLLLIIAAIFLTAQMTLAADTPVEFSTDQQVKLKAANAEIKAIESAPAIGVRQVTVASEFSYRRGVRTKTGLTYRIVNPGAVKREFCEPSKIAIDSKIHSYSRSVKEPTAEQRAALADEIGGVGG
jgi:transcriptional regulator with XRE-family HTH domain